MTSLHKFILSLFVAIIFALPALAQNVSEEAERYMFRGEAAMEDATSTSDFQKAVREFKRATELAPNWANAWFNLGVAQERAKDLSGAIRSYRKYMTLAPDAEDYNDVRKNVIKLEYRLEEADAERRAADNQRRADEALARQLVGTWQNPRMWYYVDNKRKKKCTDQVRGYRMKITARGTQVTGTVIGTPTTHYDVKKCQSWYTNTNVPYFKARVINGRLVGTINVVWYSSDGAGIAETKPWNIGIEMSNSGYTFKEIHEGEEPNDSYVWLKE